jgi:hypothetical protein
MNGFRTICVLGLFGCFLLPAASHAVIVLILDDLVDDRDVVLKAQEQAAVAGMRKQVQAIRRRLLEWTARDFQAIFGKPARAVRTKGYAMMCCEPRSIGLSGLRYADEKLNKDHTESYAIEKVGRLDVYYGLDGETPCHVHFYLEMDDHFVKLGRVENVERRLAWERPKFNKMVDWLERRWNEVVVWEVDLERERKEYQGIRSPDFDVKLNAMLRWGEQRRYRLQHWPAQKQADRRWYWYDGDRVMAEVMGTYCIFYRHDGRTRLRDETGMSLQMIRWYRTDGTMVRLEMGNAVSGTWQPTTWCWYDKNQEGIRTEWDTNGDGVPDAFRKDAFHERGPRLPLAVKDSWAVRPELIPEAFRVPEEPERRVALRKISR